MQKVFGILAICFAVTGFAAAEDDLKHKIETSDYGGAHAMNRGLAIYLSMFGEPLLMDLSALGRDDHWIDGGSGNSVALEDYVTGKATVGSLEDLTKQPWYQVPERAAALAKLIKEPPAKRARVTGITVEGRTPPTYDGRLRVLMGRFLEVIPIAEITGAGFGKANFITDVYGVLAYTWQLDRAVRKYLTILKDGGTVYFENVLNSYTWVCNKAGELLTLQEWLKRLPNVRVQRIATPRAYLLEKEAGAENGVPELQLVRLVNNSPPLREFEETGRIVSASDDEMDPKASQKYTNPVCEEQAKRRRP